MGAKPDNELLQDKLQIKEEDRRTGNKKGGRNLEWRKQYNKRDWKLIPEASWLVSCDSEIAGMCVCLHQGGWHQKMASRCLWAPAGLWWTPLWVKTLSPSLSLFFSLNYSKKISQFIYRTEYDQNKLIIKARQCKKTWLNVWQIIKNLEICFFNRLFPFVIISNHQTYTL